MPQAGYRLHLFLEPRQYLLIVDFADQLQSNNALKLLVPSLIDLPHAPLTQQLLHFIARDRRHLAGSLGRHRSRMNISSIGINHDGSVAEE
jgi:hypothetical protein